MLLECKTTNKQTICLVDTLEGHEHQWCSEYHVTSWNRTRVKWGVDQGGDLKNKTHPSNQLCLVPSLQPFCWRHTVPKLISDGHANAESCQIGSDHRNILKPSGHSWGHRKPLYKLQLCFYCNGINFGRHWEIFGMPKNSRWSCQRHLFIYPSGVNLGTVWCQHQSCTVRWRWQHFQTKPLS